MNIPDLILSTLVKASSHNPAPFSHIHRAVQRAGPETALDELQTALAALLDQRLLATCRITRDGITQDVYWPTGLKRFIPPTIEEIRMSTEPKNSQLERLIVLHGPINGPALAEKARETGMNCPAKNIHGLLASRVTSGEIIALKTNGVTVYMTPSQAEDKKTEEEASAHVMSTPINTKQTDAEIAALKSQIHGLLNDVAAANLIFSQLADTLKVEKPEQIPAAIDELTQALATRGLQPAPVNGKLALLLIDSAELIEIDELDQYDAANAQQLAVRNIELGHAARAIVVRILGEAKRRVEWKEAA